MNRKKARWDKLATIFRHRHKAYFADAKKVVDKVHKSYLMGREIAYLQIADDIVSAILVHGLRPQFVISDWRKTKQVFTRQARTFAKNKVGAARLKGMSDSLREAIAEALYVMRGGA